MNIRCRYCGEPWDNDTLHDVYDERDRKVPYARAAKLFRTYGCPAMDGRAVKCSGAGADPGIGELTDLLGGDMDGLAAMLEDFEPLLRGRR